jgi:glutathionyl-hydroquinone reductase
MLYDAFDSFLPAERREKTKGEAGLLPPHLHADIEAMNGWVYNTVNNGVYKTGFASTQEAYEDHVFPLFRSLDRLEAHLSDPAHQPYLFGENITEADIRLFTTLIRFDVSYHSIFKCNLKMIRHDYPQLHRWLRNLYWDETERTRGAFRKTVRFAAVGASSFPTNRANN